MDKFYLVGVPFWSYTPILIGCFSSRDVWQQIFENEKIYRTVKVFRDETHALYYIDEYERMCLERL